MNRDIYGENDRFRVPERILQVSEEEPVDAMRFTATDSQVCFLCDKLRAGRSSRVLNKSIDKTEVSPTPSRWFSRHAARRQVIATVAAPTCQQGRRWQHGNSVEYFGRVLHEKRRLLRIEHRTRTPVA